MGRYLSPSAPQGVALAATGVADVEVRTAGVAVGAPAPTGVTCNTTWCGAPIVITGTLAPVHSDGPSVTRACARYGTVGSISSMG